MGKVCRIFRKENGLVIKVETKEGVISNLYKQIEQRVDTQEEAVNLWLISKTESFKRVVIDPLRDKYVSKVQRTLKSFGIKKDNFKVFSEGKEVATIQEKNLKTEQVRGTGELRTFSLFSEEGNKKERIGRIRFKFSDENNIIIDSSLLSPLQQENGDSIKNLGFGTKMYAEFINFALRNNFNVFSSTNLSPESTAVWQKLVREGVAERDIKNNRFMVKRLPSQFDENEEPNLGILLNYVERKAEVPNISLRDEVEIKKAMVGISVEDSNELLEKLEKAFYKDGFFNPTQESLESVKLYTPSEITDILLDAEVKDKIKDFISKLRELETPIDNDLGVDEAFVVIKDGTRNGIGKFNLENPFLIEKEIIEKLAGIDDRLKFEEAMFEEERISSILATPYLQRLNTPQDFFLNYRTLYKAPVVTIEENQLTTKLDDVRVRLEKTILVNENEKIAKKLDFLINLEDSVWIESPKVLEQLLTQVEKMLLDTGIDVVGFVDLAFSRPVEDTKDFFRGIEDYFIEANNKSFDKLIQAYRTYFNVDSSLKTKPVVVPKNIKRENIFFLNSDENKPDLFKNYGLIPIGFNIFKRVVKDFKIDEMYELLYNTTISDTFSRVLPDIAFFPTAFTDGSFDLNKLKNKENKEFLINDMRVFINGVTKDIVGSDNLNAEEKERYALAYYYYNKSGNFNKFDFTPSMATESIIFNNPIKNREYLMTNFLADFNLKVLKEKQKNSKAYQEFYSNFEFLETGIEIISDNPIFRENSKLYLEDNTDLINYFLLKKSPTKLGQTQIIDSSNQIQDDLFLRNYYSNYPHTAPKFNGNYTKLNSQEIYAQTNKKFIRVSGNVYEIVKSGVNFSVYGKIFINNEPFKKYISTVNPPTIRENTTKLINLDSNTIDTDIKLNPLYSKEEKEKIDKDKNNCNL